MSDLTVSLSYLCLLCKLPSWQTIISIGNLNDISCEDSKLQLSPQYQFIHNRELHPLFPELRPLTPKLQYLQLNLCSHKILLHRLPRLVRFIIIRRLLCHFSDHKLMSYLVLLPSTSLRTRWTI